MVQGVCLPPESDTQDVYKFPDGSGRLVDRGFFFRRELDLYDLLDTFRPKLHRNSHEKSLDPIFAFEIDRTGENLLLVLQDCFDHLDGRSRRGVVCRSGLQQVDYFGAALSGAGNDGFEFFFRYQLGKGNTRYGRIAREWDHVIAVAAKNE